MPSLRSLLRPPGAALTAVLLLSPILGPARVLAAPATTPGSGPLAAPTTRGSGDALAAARAERDAVEAALDAAKRAAEPGHLLDPLPDRLMAGIGDLQAQYAELERKAAGYRATLGDQHPTLKGTEEAMADLRRQILDRVHQVVASAQGDAARARAAVATLERQARAAEATGSVARAAPVLAAGSPVADTAGIAPVAVSAAIPVASEPPRQAPRDAPPAGRAAPGGAAGAKVLARALAIAASEPLTAGAGIVAALAGLWILALIRHRVRRQAPVAPPRIEPAAPVQPTSASAPDRLASALPPPAAVLGHLAFRAGDTAAAVRARLDRGGDEALARAAASIFATLAAAANPRRQVSVLVTPAGTRAEVADAAALALAAAAAAAGRRTLLVDGHPDGRLAWSLAPEAAPAATVSVGGRTRSVGRLLVAGHVLALLGGEATLPAASLAPRLPDLDGFDAIVVAGGTAAAASPAAAFALAVAPRGAGAAELAAAAQEAAGRPFGLVLADLSVEETERPRRADPPAVRRRLGPDAAGARLGLRRAADPIRRRA